MKVITVTNQKGGVGKTTTVQHLGVALKEVGCRVLLIDADQQTNLTYALNVDYPFTIYEVITGKCKTEDAIYHSQQCDIISGSIKLANADIEFNKTGKEYLFKEAIDQIKDKYDFVIIDTPPALGTITVNALTCSDEILIPAQAEVFSMQGLGQLKNLIEDVKKYTNPNIKIDGILLTKYSERTILSRNLKSTMETIANSLNTKVYKATIRDATAIKEAQTKKTNVFWYDKKSKVAKDYADFINEFIRNHNKEGEE